MKGSIEEVGGAEDRDLGEQARCVIEEQVRRWEAVVMEWMQPETDARECEEMVERCRKVADEVEYLEASVLPI